MVSTRDDPRQNRQNNERRSQTISKWLFYCVFVIVSLICQPGDSLSGTSLLERENAPGTRRSTWKAYYRQSAHQNQHPLLGARDRMRMVQQSPPSRGVSFCPSAFMWHGELIKRCSCGRTRGWADGCEPTAGAPSIAQRAQNWNENERQAVREAGEEEQDGEGEEGQGAVPAGECWIVVNKVFVSHRI